MTSRTGPYYGLLEKLSSVRGKTVLVTGGASGIGNAICRVFASAGANVWIVDLQKAQAESLAKELSNAATMVRSYVADVTQQADCEKALAAVAEKTGQIDVLITSAGIVRPATSAGNSAEDIRQMLEVNFFGSVHFVQGAIPLMRKSGGRIVCVGSIAGETTIANRDGYCASKAALHAWAMTRAPELRKENILLNVIAPGRVLTELVKAWLSKNENPSQAFRAGCATQSSGTMLLPEAVAEMVFLLATDVYPVAGTVIDLSDGWGRGFQGNPSSLPAAFEDFRSYAIEQLGLAGV